MNSKEPYDDLESLREMFGANFGEVVTIYRTDTPARIAAMRKAACEEDRLAMARLAHALGGSCASIGAMRMANLCRKLECRCNVSMFDEWSTLLDAINEEYTHIDAQLQSAMQNQAVNAVK